MNIKESENGKVMLIAGGGEVYTDTVTRFVKSERELEEIVASPYNKKIIQNIIDSGHEAALEFDWFIFGVEGYSRVTEVQLVRKRIASYMIKSGRVEHKGNRSFDVVLPDNIRNHSVDFEFNLNDFRFRGGQNLGDKLPKDIPDDVSLFASIDYEDILEMIESWYNRGVKENVSEEDLRYLKPQATEFKGAIGMNARALKDFFKVRCCKKAQHGIRDMATKMLKLCKENAPDLFEDAGANCVRLGYCPENDLQHKDCSIITKEEAMEVLDDYKKDG